MKNTNLGISLSLTLAIGVGVGDVASIGVGESLKLPNSDFLITVFLSIIIIT